MNGNRAFSLTSRNYAFPAPDERLDPDWEKVKSLQARIRFEGRRASESRPHAEAIEFAGEQHLDSQTFIRDLQETLPGLLLH